MAGVPKATLVEEPSPPPGGDYSEGVCREKKAARKTIVSECTPDPSLNSTFDFKPTSDLKQLTRIARQNLSCDLFQRKAGQKTLKYAIRMYPKEIAATIDAIKKTGSPSVVTMIEMGLKVFFNEVKRETPQEKAVLLVFINQAAHPKVGHKALTVCYQSNPPIASHSLSDPSFSPPVSPPLGPVGTHPMESGEGSGITVAAGGEPTETPHESPPSSDAGFTVWDVDLGHEKGKERPQASGSVFTTADPFPTVSWFQSQDSTSDSRMFTGESSPSEGMPFAESAGEKSPLPTHFATRGAPPEEITPLGNTREGYDQKTLADPAKTDHQSPLPEFPFSKPVISEEGSEPDRDQLKGFRIDTSSERGNKEKRFSRKVEREDDRPVGTVVHSETAVTPPVVFVSALPIIPPQYFKRLDTPFKRGVSSDSDDSERKGGGEERREGEEKDDPEEEQETGTS